MEQIQNKSIFITVLSWILIVLNGFGLLISVLQNIMINVMFDRNVFNDISNSSEDFPNFIFSYFNYIILLYGLIILYSFISSIGLLKRKNWARISYVVLFGIGALYMVTMMVYQWFFTQNINDVFNSPNNDFDKMFLMMRVFTLILTLGLTGLFSWLITKLLSKNIRDEFKNAS